MSPVKRLLLVALLIGFVLIPDVNAGGKQKVIKKVKKLLTKFATDAQLGKICDALAVDIYNMADTHTLANDAINIVMKSLTGSQMTQGIQIYNQIVNDFGGMENAMNVLNQVIGIFTDNLGGILTSVQSKIQEMKDSGTSQDDCIKKGYNLVDKKFTKKLVQKIMTQVQKKLNPSDWHIIRNDLGSVIFFDKYGL